MFEDFVAELQSSWPIIPMSAVYLFGLVTVAVGMVLMLRDQDARDPSRLHGIGLTLVGIGIFGVMLMGVWNVGMSMALMVSHSNAYAVSAPIDRR